MKCEVHAHSGKRRRHACRLAKDASPGWCCCCRSACCSRGTGAPNCGTWLSALTGPSKRPCVSSSPKSKVGDNVTGTSPSMANNTESPATCSIVVSSLPSHRYVVERRAASANFFCHNQKPTSRQGRRVMSESYLA